MLRSLPTWGAVAYLFTRPSLGGYRQVAIARRFAAAVSPIWPGQLGTGYSGRVSMMSAWRGTPPPAGSTVTPG